MLHEHFQTAQGFFKILTWAKRQMTDIFQGTKIQNNFIHDAQYLSQISSNSQANCLDTKDLGESQLWQHHSGNQTRTTDVVPPDHELDGGLQPRRKLQSPWRPGWRARSDSKSPSIVTMKMSEEPAGLGVWKL